MIERRIYATMNAMAKLTAILALLMSVLVGGLALAQEPTTG